MSVLSGLSWHAIWHGQPGMRRLPGAPIRRQLRLDTSSPPPHQSVCLQSTFTLSVTVAGLGLNLISVYPSRPLSGLVVARCSGQPGRFLHASKNSVKRRSTCSRPHSVCGGSKLGLMPQGRPAIPADLKRRVLMEAGHRCAIPTCRTVPVELAHIEPYSEVRGHAFENLITLCPTCHA